MRILTKSLLVGSLLASAAFADYNIAIPGGTADVSTKYGVGADTNSTTALQIKDMSGATYYVGKASSASLTETTAGELSLKYSLVYAAADGAYGTAVGILLPLTAAWDIKDLTAMTGISYQIKVATAGLTAHLIIGSDAYPQEMKDENSALVSKATDPLTTTYATINVLPTELQSPGWAKASNALTTGWKVDPEDVNYAAYTVGIGVAVKDLNFQPILDPAWGTGGTAFKTTAAATVCTNNTLTIKNVVIKGIEKYGIPAGKLCSGNFAFLDDFSATSWLDGTDRAGNAPNYFGGYWYAFSDTASAPVAGADTAVGMSAITLPTGKRTWTPTLGAGAFVTATLEKNVPTSTYVYHKFAGWTDIGTDLTNPETGEPTNFNQFGTGSLTAIGFDLYAGAAAATIVTGASFDTNLIERITLKLSKLSVTDDAPYQVDINAKKAVTGKAGGNTGLTDLCVDLTDLNQPGWYNSKHGGAVAFTADDLTKIAWEIKIEDQKDPTKHTSTASTFGVTNVKFFGISKSDLALGVKGGRTSKSGLKAWYNGVALSLSGLVANASQIEIVRLDGSKVASFKVPANSKSMSVPVSLKGGNYVVSVAGTGSRAATALAVAR